MSNPTQPLPPQQPGPPNQPYAHDPYAQGPSAPPEKKGLGTGAKALIAVSVVVLLIVLAAVAAELVVRKVVSDQVSDEMGQSLGVESQLEFGTTPVLWSMATGTFSTLRLTSDGTPHPDIDEADPNVAAMAKLQPEFDFTGRDVTSADDQMHFGELDGSITVTDEAMTRTVQMAQEESSDGTAGFLEGLTRVESVTSNPGEGVLDVSIGGMAEAVVRPGIANGQLQLEPEGGSIFGFTLPPELLGGVSGALDSGVEGLPPGLEMTDVELIDGGLRLFLSGRDVTFE